MSNTLLTRSTRKVLAGLVFAGSLGLGLAAVAGAAPTDTTRPPRPTTEATFNCKRAANALRVLRQENQHLILRYNRLETLRDEAAAAGQHEAVARIDKALELAKTRHAQMVERAKTIAAKLRENCAPADHVPVDGTWDLEAA